MSVLTAKCAIKDFIIIHYAVCRALVIFLKGIGEGL